MSDHIVTDNPSTDLPAWIKNAANAYAQLQEQMRLKAEENERENKERQAAAERADGERLTVALKEILGEDVAAQILGGPDAVAQSGYVRWGEYEFVYQSPYVNGSKITHRLALRRYYLPQPDCYATYGTIETLAGLGKALQYLDEECLESLARIERVKQREAEDARWAEEERQREEAERQQAEVVTPDPDPTPTLEKSKGEVLAEVLAESDAEDALDVITAWAQDLATTYGDSILANRLRNLSDWSDASGCRLRIIRATADISEG